MTMMDAIADNPTKEADDATDSVLKTQDENVPIQVPILIDNNFIYF